MTDLYENAGTLTYDELVGAGVVLAELETRLERRLALLHETAKEFAGQADAQVRLDARAGGIFIGITSVRELLREVTAAAQVAEEGG